MSTPQRIALIVAALVVAIVAFVIAGSGGDDEPQRSSAATSARTDTGKDSAAPQATTNTPPSEPTVTRIQIQDGAVVGGPKTIDVIKGDTVRIVVSADAPDDIHLHGYDIERSVSPAGPRAFASRQTPKERLRSRAMWPRTRVATRWSPAWSSRLRDPVRLRARRPFGPAHPAVAVRL